MCDLLIINRESRRHKYPAAVLYSLPHPAVFVIASDGLAWHPLSAIIVV
ncbi:hypothetical protein D083_1578 [Dickeya solani RNS 08.23.3.1.A]|nr:hypothetical protein D083_1578 [Dickeya solani RNS 08.23.3.1.A]